MLPESEKLKNKLLKVQNQIQRKNELSNLCRGNWINNVYRLSSTYMYFFHGDGSYKKCKFSSPFSYEYCEYEYSNGVLTIFKANRIIDSFAHDGESKTFISTMTEQMVEQEYIDPSTNQLVAAQMTATTLTWGPANPIESEDPWKQLTEVIRTSPKYDTGKYIYFIVINGTETSKNKLSLIFFPINPEISVIQ